MSFDENTVSRAQQKLAQKFIDLVLDESQLEHPTNYVIKGLNFNEEIVKLEFQKFEKNEKEIKKIDKKIKSIQNYVRDFVKVVFEFDKNPKKLICKSDIMETSKSLFIPRYTWSGVLDFPIANSFLFGRVSKSRKHGGGDYCFAPCENLKSDINFEQLEEKAPNLFPNKIIEFNPFIELMGTFKFTKEAKDLLKQMPSIIKSSEKTTPLVDALNQQKELINVLKKIAHFGTTEWYNIQSGRLVRFMSEVDVSTVFIPYKEVTYFHIDQFVKTPKKEFRAINALLQSLEQLNS